ncbi:MAG: hypothetical protein UW09_C0001G0079 [candidate division TM6 bacterium GW2011_GWF2_43_87]|nr:MAG: hypothetical protein UW09_C0001G0079 [candidate division TM6 bacterium GW2011_GWF2_43_87]
MKKSLMKVSAVLGLLTVGVMAARTVDLPLPGMNTPFMFYPVQYHWDCPKSDDCCWDWNFVAGAIGYHRAADASYGPCNGRCKVPYVNLLFGKANFRLAEIFQGATVTPADTGNNPFISFATIKPRFEYNESGAIFTADLGSTFDWCDTGYRLGLRAKLPFRDIEVSDTCAASDLVGETLKDVWQVRQEDTTNPAVTNTVFAGRLDFLTALNRVAIPNQTLVDYRNATQNAMLMAGQVVDAAAGNGTPVIAVIGRSDSTMPMTATPAWGAQSAAIIVPVGANGSGVATDVRGSFINGNNYLTGGLATDPVAQSKLFVVPTLDSANKVVQGASIIRGAIEVAIQNMDASAMTWMDQVGLRWCNGRSKGVGDLDLEFYLGRNWGCCESLWTDLQFAVRCPTGKDLCCRDINCCRPNSTSANSCDACCKRLLKLPLGNNKHTELRIGLAGGYDICDWVKFMIDGNYSWALRHKEYIAAPFQGATVKNIGPCIPANIKWGYFVGHADLSFYASDCCGMAIGYELYHKNCDCVQPCVSTATDLLGRTAQKIDASVARRYTNRTANKAHVNFFTRIGDCQIAAGWAQVFAGKNVPHDTDWYLNMSVTF